MLIQIKNILFLFGIGALLVGTSSASFAQDSAPAIKALADRVMYLDESHTDSFLYYSREIEARSAALNYQRGICDSYRLRGIYHECRAEYDKSIEWHLKNLSLSQQIGDTESQLSALADIAVQYHYLNQLKEAREYIRKAIELGEKTGTKPKRMSSFFMNMGVFFRKSEMADSALYYYNKSLAIKKQLNDSVGISNVMVNIGTLLIDQKKYATALPYIQFNKEYHLRTHDSISLWFDLISLSQIDIGEKQFASAQTYLEQASAIAERIQSKQKYAETLRQYVTLYENQGDFRRAFDYLKQYQQVEAEIINVETSTTTVELQEKYEAKRREQENRLLTLEIEAQKAGKNNLLIISFLIALLAAVAGWSWWKNHQKRQLLVAKNTELSAERDKLQNTLQRLHQMKEQLMQSEKMASIGQLTAGIAHEINNPINFVGSSLQALRMNMADIHQLLTPEQRELPAYQELHDEIRMLLDNMQRGIDRTSDIILGLRTFSRNEEEGEMTVVQLHEVIDAAIILIAHEAKHRCEIIRQYGHSALVTGLPGKLNQVFINCLSNAIHAIQQQHAPSEKPTGRIVISTQLQGAELVTTIVDNGSGMDETTLKKVFEPFFTTKPVGEGTGLGMAISYGIIRQHKGTMSLHSTIGQGTTVEIRLPAVVE